MHSLLQRTSKTSFVLFNVLNRLHNKFPNCINDHNDKQECKFKRSDIIYEIFSKLGVIIRSESSWLKNCLTLSALYINFILDEIKDRYFPNFRFKKFHIGHIFYLVELQVSVTL